MDEVESFLPEDDCSGASKGSDLVVPQKSRSVYEKEYVRFIKWMEENSVDAINQNVVMEYFQEMAESLAANSLWTKFSMLKRELMIKKKIKSDEKFDKLQEYLKKLQKTHKPRKSKVLTREQVLRFLKDAPDEKHLMHKVVLIMFIFGVCKRYELVKMRFTDVKDVGSYIIVNIPTTETDKGRTFMIIDEDEICALDLVRRYMALRPENVSNDRFFLSLRENRCTSQPVGKNTFGTIPSKIAEYLGLANAADYTGHCLRRTSTQLYADSGGSMSGPMQMGMHMGGWNNPWLEKNDIGNSESSISKEVRLLDDVETSSYIEMAASPVEETNTTIVKNEAIDIFESTEPTAGFHFSGEFHSCTFTRRTDGAETDDNKLFNAENNSTLKKNESFDFRGEVHFSGVFHNCAFYL